MAKNNHFRILVSACLLGERVRYDAKINAVKDKLICTWRDKGWLLSICPEIEGGLATPRPAAEIQVNGKIATKSGQDVTAAFMQGAEKALQLAQQHNIKIAILTEKSPSCGSSQRYDGSFTGRLITGEGCTAKLLREHGIQVFNQWQLPQVQAYLTDLDNDSQLF